MLELNYRHCEPYLQEIGWSSHSEYNHYATLILDARNSFDKARRRGQSGSLFARLSGCSRALLDLNQVQCALSERHYAGLKTVTIKAIQGSEGRCHDFDSEWLPLRSVLIHRWTSVYVAMLEGIPMPPVTLIQVGDIYFVRDGHHRTSVARLRGCEVIEAEVTVWNTANEPILAANGAAGGITSSKRWWKSRESVAVP